jgi:hypothetical protein
LNSSNELAGSDTKQCLSAVSEVVNFIEVCSDDPNQTVNPTLLDLRTDLRSEFRDYPRFSSYPGKVSENCPREAESVWLVYEKV